MASRRSVRLLPLPVRAIIITALTLGGFHRDDASSPSLCRWSPYLSASVGLRAVVERQRIRMSCVGSMSLPTALATLGASSRYLRSWKHHVAGLGPNSHFKSSFMLVFRPLVLVQDPVTYTQFLEGCLLSLLILRLGSNSPSLISLMRGTLRTQWPLTTCFLSEAPFTTARETQKSGLLQRVWLWWSSVYVSLLDLV